MMPWALLAPRCYGTEPMSDLHILMEADWGDLAYAIAIIIFGLVSAIAGKFKKKAEGGQAKSSEEVTLEDVLGPIREAMMRKKQEQEQADRPPPLPREQQRPRPAPPAKAQPAPQRRPKPVVRQRPEKPATPTSQRRPTARQVVIPIPGAGRPRQEASARPAAAEPAAALPEDAAAAHDMQRSTIAPRGHEATSPLAYLHESSALRRAIVAAELFGKPVSLREDHLF